MAAVCYRRDAPLPPIVGRAAPKTRGNRNGIARARGGRRGTLARAGKPQHRPPHAPTAQRRSMAPDGDIAHAHNFFLQSALDFGLPGLIALLAIYLVLVVQIVQLWRAPQPATGALPLQATWRTWAIGLAGCLVAQTVYSQLDAVAVVAIPLGVVFKATRRDWRLRQGLDTSRATGLILRWMPSSTHPMAPRLHRERIVHIQCMHGGATTICLANNLRAILAPLEVIAPSLVAWIEQTYWAALRVTTYDLCAFVLIAGTARQPKVIRIVRATGSYGDDMINL